MSAETVIAVAATVIALGSLWVSWSQTRATRLHNRQSVRPLLRFRRIRQDDLVGLKIVNAGLGPAVVTRSTVSLDGVVVGAWDREVKPRLFPPEAWPRTYSLRPGSVLLAGQAVFLVSLEGGDPGRFREMWDLIDRRLAVEVVYESLYGGEGFSVTSARPDGG
ncbi:hypothetical protein AB0E75_18675 [Streptomyces griseoviridis]|jgi:hypothetical protein|uniref:Uncharacterized protein n=3 Tax=Streptomyces TaxID=1883 RepID=A0A918L7G7_STRGD|nr:MULTISPECIES: hypothetical protein [Streptomyces]MDP9681998.1 hypothetical protein [Streptomyces griseoviridis]GGS17005.1 hypothetical protein GCM10010238_01080 [Streptomyces niveoruber]GGT03243.1 hypothetical protein GCM10010240_40800 [Streptomyces griseoviridis]GGU35460.1 hypothetical protein GCM10010259_27460 [Streptomyces daghestanicus]GHI34013.1 hypothetical protein Sdagh_57430 [Streptomyces daghestanicus]